MRILQNRNIATGEERETIHTLDGLGRTIRTKTSFTDKDGEREDAITEIYYDANGNQIRIVDANNTPLSYENQKASIFTYSAKDEVLSEIDPAGNITSYRALDRNNIV